MVVGGGEDMCTDPSVVYTLLSLIVINIVFVFIVSFHTAHGKSL
jgi:hypothetical protein